LKLYPRTYWIDARTRRAQDAVGIAPLALVIAVSLLDLAGLVNKALTPSALLSMGFLAGLYALSVFRNTHRHVILYEDGIEVLAWFSSRKLNRNEILGRRMGGMDRRNVHGSFYVIVPVDKATKELRLPRFLHVDKEFSSWIEGIPTV
jgi:hypothetical protein